MTQAHNNNLHLIEHPLVAQLLGEARTRTTPPAQFRDVLARCGALLAYEATRDLATTSVTVPTPLEDAPARRIASPITIVPILRAGLGLAQGVIELLPGARVCHVGMFRDETSLKPVSYYNKLPNDLAAGVVLLVDPMLATGGSAVKAVDILRDLGCKDVRLICLLAAPEGVARLHQHHADLPIYTAAVDRQLNASGFILPGLGDAGDRLYGTGENSLES